MRHEARATVIELRQGCEIGRGKLRRMNTVCVCEGVLSLNDLWRMGMTDQGHRCYVEQLRNVLERFGSRAGGSAGKFCDKASGSLNGRMR